MQSCFSRLFWLFLMMFPLIVMAQQKVPKKTYYDQNMLRLNDKNGASYYQENKKIEGDTKHLYYCRLYTSVQSLVAEGHKSFKREESWEGLVKHYQPNGKAWAEENYQAGVLEGPARYWNREGQDSCSGHFEEGKRQGLWITPDRNGKLVQQHYAKGLALGSTKVDSSAMIKITYQHLDWNFPDRDKINYYNWKGEALFELHGLDSKWLGKDLFQLQKESGWWIIDRSTGMEVGPYRAMQVSGDYFIVKNRDNRGALFGLVNRHLKEVIPIKYRGLEAVGNDLFIARSESGIGLVNAQHELILPLEYHQLDLVREGMLRARFQGKMGIIDLAGNVLTPFEYEMILLDEQGVLCACKNDVGYVIQSDGKPGTEKCPCLDGLLFSDNRPDRKGPPNLFKKPITTAIGTSYSLKVVKEDDKFGVQESGGTWIIPPEYDIIWYYKNGLIEAAVKYSKGSQDSGPFFKRAVFNDLGEAIIPLQKGEIEFEFAPPQSKKVVNY